MTAKQKNKGFTLVELLTTLALIMMLVGMLVPSMTKVRDIANGVKQKAQLATIDMAMTAFRSDYGDYPPSEWFGPASYVGAQQLAEALLGWDLLGFYPGTNWYADGSEYMTIEGRDLTNRRGPYLELGTTNAFTLNSLFGRDVSVLRVRNGDRFVICDVFGAKKITVGDHTFNAGTPILYYRANPASRIMKVVDPRISIYNSIDNLALVDLGRMTDGRRHPLLGDESAAHNECQGLYYDTYKVIDPKIIDRDWPYRPDSYILISAGKDGLYGTGDDITNIGN